MGQDLGAAAASRATAAKARAHPGCRPRSRPGTAGRATAARPAPPKPRARRRRCAQAGPVRRPRRTAQAWRPARRTQRPRLAPPPGAEGELHVAHQKGAKRAHAVTQEKARRVEPSVSCVATIAMPPSSQCSPMSSRGQTPSRRIERRQRFIEQPERAVGSGSGAPAPGAAAARRTDIAPADRRGASGRRDRARSGTSIRAPYSAAKNCAFSGHRELRPSRRRDDRSSRQIARAPRHRPTA